jgi:hypothetical protein
MARELVVSVGEVVWQLVNAIDTAATSAIGAKRAANSVALGHTAEEIISASSGPPTRLGQ